VPLHLFTPSTPAVNAAVDTRGRILPAMPPVPLDGPSLTLALVEAQVGSLVDVLPVALLVTSPTGEILRANAAAVELLDDPALVGQSVTATLGVAEREHSLTVRVRWLQHERDVLRLYVIHEAER
jgi:PAS domain-containing protein